jgi:hypothetical protein
VLFVLGWFTNGGLTPHYNEPNQAWTDWARDNQSNSSLSAFLMLLAGFVSLHFMGTIRTVLGGLHSPARGSEQLARERAPSSPRPGPDTSRRLRENLRLVRLSVMFSITAPGSDVYPFDAAYCRRCTV